MLQPKGTVGTVTMSDNALAKIVAVCESDLYQYL